MSKIIYAYIYYCNSRKYIRTMKKLKIEEEEKKELNQQDDVKNRKSNKKSNKKSKEKSKEKSKKKSNKKVIGKVFNYQSIFEKSSNI